MGKFHLQEAVAVGAAYRPEIVVWLAFGEELEKERMKERRRVSRVEFGEADHRKEGLAADVGVPAATGLLYDIRGGREVLTHRLMAKHDRSCLILIHTRAPTRTTPTDGRDGEIIGGAVLISNRALGDGRIKAPSGQSSPTELVSWRDRA